MSSSNHSVSNDKKGLWYTYFGKGGAAVFAFMWIVLLLIFVFSILKWG